MLRLTNITVTQFRNYSLSSFRFGERVTGICGSNGRGKTNLLDAIYYLCFTKSYFAKTESLTVQFGATGCRLEGIVEMNGSPDKIVCINRGAGKKEVLLNDVEYERFSQHIGKFPCVMIAPDDIELVTGTGEDRRKYMDTLLSQVNPDYLQQLILYNKVLQQRNSLLKRFAEQGKSDLSLLEVLDQQLEAPGNYIYAERSQLAARLVPLVQQFYVQIAGNGEQISLQYESQLNNSSFPALLQKNRERDMYLQRTNGGTHKDDIIFLLDGHVFKSTASQGQRKSLLFALKLAEFALLKEAKGFAPFLLLDDVFEKLDDQRMNNLLHWVCKENDGQVFITDTHRERLEKAFSMLGTGFDILEL